jgi:cytoskeletal protein RodZ
MGEFGKELRTERESRGIGLDTISDSTKISGRYLAALEEDHFEQLPGGVFNKGIVRSYARVVGLDEETWVNRYMEAYQQSGQLKTDDADWIAFAENVGKSREKEGQRPDLRLRWAGVAMLLLLLVGLGWFVWHFVSDRVASSNAYQQHSVSASTNATALVPAAADSKR